MMAFLFGAIAAFVGACVWAGITYATNYEIGYVAWAIGGLVGFAVRLGAKQNEGMIFGLLAVGLSIVSIIGAKWMTTELLISKIISKSTLTQSLTDQEIQFQLINETLAEFEKEKKEINWPPGFNFENASEPKHYPKEVVDKAQEKLKALTPQDRENMNKERQQIQNEFARIFFNNMRMEIFKKMFSLMDILFFILAAATAFKLGSGATSEE